MRGRKLDKVEDKERDTLECAEQDPRTHFVLHVGWKKLGSVMRKTEGAEENRQRTQLRNKQTVRDPCFIARSSGKKNHSQDIKKLLLVGRRRPITTSSCHLFATSHYYCAVHHLATNSVYVAHRAL